MATRALNPLASKIVKGGSPADSYGIRHWFVLGFSVFVVVVADLTLPALGPILVGVGRASTRYLFGFRTPNERQENG